MTEIVDLEAEIGRFYPAPVAAVTASLIRATHPRPQAIERSHAHIVVVPVTGDGWHLVDFDRYPISPGRAVHVQPGQVHRFDPDGTYEAVVAVIRSAVCPPALFPPGEHHPAGELGAAAPIVVALVEDLRREQEAEAPSDSIMVATAELLLRHIARATGSAPSTDRSSPVGMLRAFREELEQSFASARSVSYYASEIGTSPKTLSRTTSNLVGQSPKELIDERVAVEAKRLLVYTADPIATIGAGLGFSEATNFTKFFTRVVGVSPHDFRDLTSALSHFDPVSPSRDSGRAAARSRWQRPRCRTAGASGVSLPSSASDQPRTGLRLPRVGVGNSRFDEGRTTASFGRRRPAGLDCRSTRSTALLRPDRRIPDH